MKLKKAKTTVYWLLFFVSSIIMLIALFGALGEERVCITDEATHGMNAYEMIQNGNIWINTLGYNVDYYNSKPPLMIWLIMLGYKLCGYNPLGLRISSAVSGLIIYIVAFIFSYKNQGKKQALVFAAFLPACELLFSFHMFRSGDMDSLYTLWFLLGVIALYYAYNNINFMIFYGVALGLAFMTKSIHAVLFLAVGIIYIIILKNRYKVSRIIKYYGLALLASVIVIFPWAIVRYRFDGLRFFQQMLFGETFTRLQNNSVKDSFLYILYFRSFQKMPIGTFSLFIFAISLLIFFCLNRHNPWASVKKIIFKPYFFLMLSWFVIIFGAYSITKSELDWYVYSAYIPLLLLTAESVNYIVSKSSNIHKYFSLIIYLVIIILAFKFSTDSIKAYSWEKNYDDPEIAFQSVLEKLDKDYPGEYDKCNVYVENTHNVSNDQDKWDHTYVFYVYTTIGGYSKDGGVEKFLAEESPQTILILDKELWGEYGHLLSQVKLLEDGKYMIFAK